MELVGNTVLITGGSEGIGLALAKYLVPDNTVIVCGRSSEKLAQAKVGLPRLVTYACDVTQPAQRTAMIEWLASAHPDLNVLINNAGARHRTDFLSGAGLDEAMEWDMALNFTAPAALTMGLLPHLRLQPAAAVINMTTGLVHLPKSEQAFYCAAKAALHSFSQSLRWALRPSRVEIYEVLLTLVATNFHRGKVPDNIPAISADEAARIALDGVRKGKSEVAVGKAAMAQWLAAFAPEWGMAIVNR